MRLIVVPDGHPKTKPRAMNYALSYARGDIVGIYDAEDRPEADQITRIVNRFAETPPRVACLQGQLDYYNTSHNWLSRMFTIEYASWFRLLLPGVQHLGLVVPLGGTNPMFSFVLMCPPMCVRTMNQGYRCPRLSCAACPYPLV